MSIIVKNIYFNIGADYDPGEFKKKILDAYSSYPKIRLIFDLDNKKIELKPMFMIKKLFEKIGVTNLEETCIIVKDGFKTRLIKRFLKMVKTQRPVRFLT